MKEKQDQQVRSSFRFILYFFVVLTAAIMEMFVVMLGNEIARGNTVSALLTMLCVGICVRQFYVCLKHA